MSRQSTLTQTNEPDRANALSYQLMKGLSEGMGGELFIVTDASVVGVVIDVTRIEVHQVLETKKTNTFFSLLAETNIT